MADQRKSARQRLVDAAFQLFSSQGVGATTTRQVADLAGVNEVTLFRQFGSKHGLLAAVMTEAEVLVSPGYRLELEPVGQIPTDQALRHFLTQCLETLDQLSELVRAVIGEAGQFSAANSQAMGRGLQTIRDCVAEYLESVLGQGIAPGLPPEEVAGLVMALLLGYAAIDSTTSGPPDIADAAVETSGLWPNRAAFIDSVVSWLLGLRPQPAEDGLDLSRPGLTTNHPNTETWIDLPAPIVHQVMQAARKAGNQTYALIYVLWGAGVAAAEVPLLTRASALYDSSQHILLVGPNHRQVPLNQWIMGRRYGTYTKNPLTRWLKSRSDGSPAMFVGPDDQPITPLRVRQLWAEVTADIASPTGAPLALEQTRATWCVDMLLKGLTRQDLSLLSGLSVEQLDPLVQKAQARSALAQALRLDQQSGSASSKLSQPPPATATDGD
ncbi:TetR/AcrR family transcriptional regulator [Nodosilinea sp. LEGE 06152]|uniref:TetR/AcrR family transcriptional regulator n=1 Tax=Nodosilinea sp. LEGE 06152 TaxID=2777966 RepID=UPI001881C187|nr:TetR/AcrR family transcriptional regulator [Nodosilinea sp. LEGE 06152]MBE9159043.1 TetR/AcrR family transcriptional regulator [Nodosilinea sp. LEGE 06152]